MKIFVCFFWLNRAFAREQFSIEILAVQGQKTTLFSLLGIFLSWLFLYFSKKCFGKVSKWDLVFEASCKRGSLGLPLSHGLLSRWLITLSPYSPNTSALTCISTLTEYAFEKLIQQIFLFFPRKNKPHWFSVNCSRNIKTNFYKCHLCANKSKLARERDYFSY